MEGVVKLSFSETFVVLNYTTLNENPIILISILEDE